MKNRIAIGVSVILAALLVWMIWKNDREEKQMEKQLLTIYEEARLLELQKWKLQNEIEVLEKDYRTDISSSATEELLVRELDDVLYTEFYPLMQEYQTVGILALSEAEFPGSDGNITSEQFAEILQNGWSFCLAWNGEEELSEWLLDMQSLLASENLNMPEVIYFEPGSYFAGADDILSEFGISVAVHHGEEELPLIATESGEGIWHPGSRPWNGTNIRSIINSFVDEGGNLAFTVSFSGEEDLYSYDSFKNMLAYIKSFRENGRLQVTDLVSARSFRRSEEDRIVQMDLEMKEKKDSLQSQINELDDQIEDVYEKYGSH